MKTPSWAFLFCCLFSFLALAEPPVKLEPLTYPKTDKYTYRTLNSNGQVEWTVSAPIEKNHDMNDATIFKKIEVERKILPMVAVLAQNHRLVTLSKIAILGDTGCRLKESAKKTAYQDCADPKEWPYPQVIQSLSKESPDLIIHVGDYHYREQCSKGKPCQKMSKEVGYGWGPWKLDFFDPSKKAFAVAPWIIVRGNHEDCQRAWVGYKALLRNSEWEKECVDEEDPEIMNFGDLTIINLDSSAVVDMPDSTPENVALWKKRMDVIGEKLKDNKSKHVWLISHKPIYGLVGFGETYAPTNINLRKYFESAAWAKRVDLIFAGHVHNSQLARAKDLPLQVVIGNGGTALDHSKGQITSENISGIGYEKAKLVQHDFGYALVKDVNTDKALVEFHEASGKTVFTCHLKERGQDCF